MLISENQFLAIRGHIGADHATLMVRPVVGCYRECVVDTGQSKKAAQLGRDDLSPIGSRSANISLEEPSPTVVPELGLGAELLELRRAGPVDRVDGKGHDLHNSFGNRNDAIWPWNQVRT